MRKVLLSLFVLLCMESHAQERSALLMVHFGTTYDGSRQKTIDAINQLSRQAWQGGVVAEAYTSPRVISRLAAKGIHKDNVIDALLRLRADGTKTVCVQPTFVIDGKEMEWLRRSVDQVRTFFDSISVGTPLLYTVADAQQVCGILARRHPADAKKRAHVVFVGHGTDGPATALYSQLDYMLRAQGYPCHHVATIEGYPTRQTLVGELKAARARSITLVPLLFVAGDHANIDIDFEWKEALQAEGFDVTTVIEGLGEVPEIQQLYIEKIPR